MNYSYTNTSSELLISYKPQNISKNFNISKDILSILSLFSNKLKNPGNLGPFVLYTWTNLQIKKAGRYSPEDKCPDYQKIAPIQTLACSIPKGDGAPNTNKGAPISSSDEMLHRRIYMSNSAKLHLTYRFSLAACSISSLDNKKYNSRRGSLDSFPLRVIIFRDGEAPEGEGVCFFLFLCGLVNICIKKPKQKIQFCRIQQKLNWCPFGDCKIVFDFFWHKVKKKEKQQMLFFGVDPIINTKFSSFFLANFYYIKNQKIFKKIKSLKEFLLGICGLRPHMDGCWVFLTIRYAHPPIEHLARGLDGCTTCPIPKGDPPKGNYINEDTRVPRIFGERACEIKQTHEKTVYSVSTRDWEKQLLNTKFKLLVSKTFGEYFKTQISQRLAKGRSPRRGKKRFILWRKTQTENKSKISKNFIKLLNLNIVSLFKNFYTFFWIVIFKNCLVYNLRFHQYLKWVYLFFGKHQKFKNSFLFFYLWRASASIENIFSCYTKNKKQIFFINFFSYKLFLSKITFVVLKIVLYITTNKTKAEGPRRGKKIY